ncbi:MAG: ComEA family DNA-binding protein [Zavarzinella sp.]
MMDNTPLTPRSPITPDESSTQQSIIRRPHGWCVAGGFALSALLFFTYVDLHSFRPSEIVQHPKLELDLNRATHAELVQLPGISDRLAKEVLSYRDQRGGFQQVNDLKNIYGIGDRTVAKISPHVVVNPLADPTTDEGKLAEESVPDLLIRKPPELPQQAIPTKPKAAANRNHINVNTATMTELDTLPGIGPVLAKAIVDARQEKPFTQLEDLRRVRGIGVARLAQLKNHVCFE